MTPSMLTLTPGICQASYRIVDATHAAQRVVALAQQASSAGTFGVGGFVMDRSGHVLAEAVNAVVDHGEVRDPTAHAERQLVDWFFGAQAQGLAIPTHDVVIVSSLDPCAMCAGAILSAGLSCVALAEDSLSGIHVSGCPHRVPPELWLKAASTFGLFEVRGRSGRASHVSPILSGDVSPQFLVESQFCFQRSLARTRSIVSRTEDASLRANEVSLRKWNKTNALAGMLPSNVYLPEEASSLGDFSSHQGAALLLNDGCLIVDEAGRVLLAAQGREDLSPARSSVLELIRAYVWLRNAAWKQFRLQLPHPRGCSLIKLRAPSFSAKAVMELGALGSFFEDEHLAHRIPAFGFLQLNYDSKTQSLPATLPPFYTSVAKITVGHVAASQHQFAL